MKHEEFHSLPGKPIRQYIEMRYDGVFSKPVKGGVLVGVNLGDGTFNVDYAIANREYDEFDADLGTRIAYGRAMANRYGKKRKRFFVENASLPRKEDIINAYINFCDRCSKYFKDCTASERTMKIYDAAVESLLDPFQELASEKD